MKLPQDPVMLMSFVNMKLRDHDYNSLQEFCDEAGIDENELIDKLKSAGFDYFPDQKQFR